MDLAARFQLQHGDVTWNTQHAEKRFNPLEPRNERGEWAHMARPAQHIIRSLREDPVTPIPADDYNPAQGYKAVDLINTALQHGDAGDYQQMMSTLGDAVASLDRDKLVTDANRLQHLITGAHRKARYDAGNPEAVTQLSKDDFLLPGDYGLGHSKSYDETVRNVAAHLSASDEDLHALAREEHLDSLSGAHGNDLKAALADYYTSGWRGGSGGPGPVEMITHIADRLGLPYQLSDSAQRTHDYITQRPAVQRALHALGDAMYSATQEWLADHGVANVEMHRSYRSLEQDAKMPFTSWSTMSGWTREGNLGGVRHEVIPAERIFSLPPTGFGTYAESEAVVLPVVSSVVNPVVKQLRRTVALTGQEEWEDVPDQQPPAAGGGAMQMAPQPVPGGVPGFTAGAEPPRWDGALPQPHVMSAPQVRNDQGITPDAGRVASPRPHAAWPNTYMDGYWPQGGHGTEQAGESSPGGKTGVPPSGMGVRKHFNPDEPRDAHGKWVKAAAKLLTLADWEPHKAELLALVRHENATRPALDHKEDRVLRRMAELQGFDAHPSEGELDPSREVLHRGFGDRMDTSNGRQLAEEYLHGAYFGSQGQHGNGAYFTTDEHRATTYGHVLHAQLHSGAKIGDSDDLYDESLTLPSDWQEIVSADAGRMAVLNGTDAYKPPRGNSRIVVNRGALRVGNAAKKYFTVSSGGMRTSSGHSSHSQDSPGDTNGSDAVGNLAPVTPRDSDASAASRANAVKTGVQDADTVKVGPEGYIHGYICVRPPCGEKPSHLSMSDLKVEKGGHVVHQPSGWSVARVTKNGDGTFTLTHADGESSIIERRSWATGHTAAHWARKETSVRAAQRVADRAAALKAPAMSNNVAGGKAGALTGDELWSSGNGLRTTDLTEDDLKMLHNTWFDYFPAMRTNGALRTSDVEFAKLPYGKDERYIASRRDALANAGALTALIRSSRPFTQPAETYRYADARTPFGITGTHSPGDLITDRGFVSVSAKPDLMEHEEHRNQAKITVRIPAGSRALRAEPQFYRTDGEYGYNLFHEYVLPPDSRFRVVSDNGDVSNRRITVEVLLPAASSIKKRIALADLVKVGPEGYIHGYICVRPPCGRYTQHTLDKKKGQVLHDGVKIGKVPSKDADGKYSAVHYRTDAAGVEVREKLPARFDTAQQAFDAIPVYHNIQKLAEQDSPENVKNLLGNAQHNFASGNVAAAGDDLTNAAERARAQGDHALAGHIDHVRSVIRGGEPVAPDAGLLTEQSAPSESEDSRKNEDKWNALVNRVLGGDNNPAVGDARDNADMTMYERYGADADSPEHSEEWHHAALDSYENAAIARHFDPVTGSLPPGEANEDGLVNGNRVTVQHQVPQSFPDRPARITGLAGNEIAQVEYDDEPGVQHIVNAYRLRPVVSTPASAAVKPEVAPSIPVTSTHLTNALTSNEQQAVEDYAGIHFSAVNNYLRDGTQSSLPEVRQKVSSTIASLDSALGKSTLTRDMVLHRSVTQHIDWDASDRAGEQVMWPSDDMKEWHDNAYSSTSEELTAMAADPARVRLDFHMPAGSHALSIRTAGLGELEKELLLPRGSSFHVIGMRKDASTGQRVFDLIPRGSGAESRGKPEVTTAAVEEAGTMVPGTASKTTADLGNGYTVTASKPGVSNVGKGIVHEFTVTGPGGKYAANALVYGRGDHVFLDQLRTAPSEQGKGLGTKLLNHVISEFPSTDIRLKPEPYGDQALSEAQLRSFYAKHGFKDDGDEMVLSRGEKPPVSSGPLTGDNAFNAIQSGERELQPWQKDARERLLG